MTKPLLRALKGDPSAPAPIWLMRQAGRYLPEYREVRAEAGGFLNLCFNPAKATEVTLQPIRRYGFDGSILFSDILIVPHALGQKVAFEAGEGPRLDPIRQRSAIPDFDPAKFDKAAEAVYEAVERIKAALPPEVTFIGFAGAPWTVATYMVEGAGSKDYANAKKWFYSEPEGFQTLIDRITEATIHYLSTQIRSGVEVVQLFDSWAGALSSDDFRRWVIEPNRRIVKALRELHPGVPVICFPRGAGLMYEEFLAIVEPDGVGLDTTVPVEWAARTLQPKACVQGNLDPLALVAGGAALDSAIDRICDALAGKPFIFNLGHGILQETNPEHVSHLVKRVRERTAFGR
ncbi:uroporphyrinogen decarboxylase [Lacibacterium aquatile]|uniref:Uroporphyrinogen decarboxylase n=1 Tax=Lacibacterium aquatile TaxID=1168082 RepID=A0ABW5DY00_9PROT